MIQRALFHLVHLSRLCALVALVACTADRPSSAQNDEPTTTTGAVPSNNGSVVSTTDPNKPTAPSTEPPTSPCTGKTGVVGDEEIALVSGGIDREATIHVPSSHDGIRALPLVLVLHPLLLTRKDMRKLVNVDRFSDEGEHAFVALFPDGIGRSWNAGECCGKAKDQNLDDVGFIRELIAHVSSKWCIDSTRLYAMGFSNGAFLAHRLACELPGGVRAIVAVAGTLGIPESSCKPAQKTAVLAIHGTEDQLVPYAGGPPNIPRGTSFGTFASPTATDAFWATENDCGAAASATPYFTKGEVSCVRHDGCRAPSSVGLCTVTGGGHQWPGGASLPAMGHVTMDLDATEAAIELYRAHGL